MSETQTIEEIAADIIARIDALDQTRPSDVEIEEIVRTQILDVLGVEDAAEISRKMRFGRSDEKLLGTKYARMGLGVGDVEALFLIQDSIKGQRVHSVDQENVGAAYPGPSEELVETMKAASEGRYQDLAVSRTQDLAALDALVKSGRMNEEGLARALEAIETVYGRAMDTAETGYGAELVGAQYASDLWQGARAEMRVFSLFNSFEMQAPTAYLPVEADLPEMLFVPETVVHPGTEYATGKTGSNRVQVDAKKFVVHQVWSGEMAEDSLVPYIPFLRGQLSRSLAYYSDSLVLNGDTTNAATGNINNDDADPADTKHFLAFDGVRHAWLVDNTAMEHNMAGAAVTVAQIVKMRGKMVDATYLHDWGHPTSFEMLPIVADPDTVDQIIGLDQVITVDKFGPGATILTGQQARIAGQPLISSIAQPKTEADGKVSSVTPANNTLGQLNVFNRGGATVGWRRRVQIESERLPGTDQTRLIASLRLGFGRFTPTGAASGIKWAAGIRNILV